MNDERDRRLHETNQQRKSRDSGEAMALGMAMGVGVGAVFGVVLGNLAIGVAIGIALGVAFGGLLLNGK